MSPHRKKNKNTNYTEDATKHKFINAYISIEYKIYFFKKIGVICEIRQCTDKFCVLKNFSEYAQ